MTRDFVELAVPKSKNSRPLSTADCCEHPQVSRLWQMSAHLLHRRWSKSLLARYEFVLDPAIGFWDEKDAWTNSAGEGARRVEKERGETRQCLGYFLKQILSRTRIEHVQTCFK
jgi:hypothetical protein